jgi:hypothetical protein
MSRDAAALCGLLAEPDRVKAFAAVVLGATTPAAVAAASHLPARSVQAALRRLEHGGLVTSVEGTLVAELSAFKDVMRDAGERAEPAEPLDPDRQRDAVLRAFIVNGRLAQYPAARGKRRIVLEHIAAAFEPGVRYPEKMVNATLRAWHDDYATLRRYLVDELLLSREDGVYWRTGGYVEVA